MPVELKLNTSAVLAEIPRKTQKALTVCGEVAHNHAVTNVERQHAVATGHLAQSINYQIWFSTTLELRAACQYAGYVEFGTGSGSSMPGATTKTSWVYPAGLGADGKMTFRTAHPMQARPYLKPALADHISDYKRIIEMVFAE